MEFDFGAIIAAVGLAVAGIAAGLYISFRKSAAEDNVENWRDSVVKSVDEFANKADSDDK